MEARIDALERELKELKMGNPPAKKEKAIRKPSPYNDFMKEELAKIKHSNPEMSHRERFKLAASRYGAKNQANKL